MTAEKKALAMVRNGASYELTERVTGVGLARLVDLLYGTPS